MKKFIYISISIILAFAMTLILAGPRSGLQVKDIEQKALNTIYKHVELIPNEVIIAYKNLNKISYKDSIIITTNRIIYFKEYSVKRSIPLDKVQRVISTPTEMQHEQVLIIAKNSNALGFELHQNSVKEFCNLINFPVEKLEIRSKNQSDN